MDYYARIDKLEASLRLNLYWTEDGIINQFHSFCGRQAYAGYLNFNGTNLEEFVLDPTFSARSPGGGTMHIIGKLGPYSLISEELARGILAPRNQEKIRKLEPQTVEFLKANGIEIYEKAKAVEESVIDIP